MTDDLRERVARALYDILEGPVANQDFARQLRQWDLALTLADAARPVIRAEALEEAAKELDKWGDIYGDNAARAIRALAAQPAPSPWRPIETAPRDELILVGPTKRMGICAAMHHSRDGWVTETCSDWVPIHTPTHWMPLPPAPKEEE